MRSNQSSTESRSENSQQKAQHTQSSWSEQKPGVFKALSSTGAGELVLAQDQIVKIGGCVSHAGS